MQKIYTLYVLECENSKYYVGITTDVYARLRRHKAGKGANFTRANKPIRIIEKIGLGVITREEAEAYENARTLELIKKIGLDSVRGGRFFRSNIKDKVLRRAYNSIDNTYKNIGPLPPIRRRREKKVHADPWGKMEAQARRELRLSYPRP